MAVIEATLRGSIRTAIFARVGMLARVGAVLLILSWLAPPSVAEDERDRALRELGDLVSTGHYEQAVQAADRALAAGDDREIVKKYKGEALLGLARRIQRRTSHRAAAEFLEKHLDHGLTAWGFSVAALGAGMEIKAAKTLRRAGVGQTHEIDLLAARGRLDEALSRAEQYGDKRWIGWLNKRIALRERLLARGRLAWKVTAAALAIMAALAAVLWRLAPSKSAKK